MAKCAYPAVFDYSKEEITVTFPDLRECHTSGYSDEEAMFYAKRNLANCIRSRKVCEQFIPKPTPLDEVKLAANQKAVLVETEEQEECNVDPPIENNFWKELFFKVAFCFTCFIVGYVLGSF